ncbi:ATP-binding protein [Ammoniphilus sp. YIM 78166]|uniref:ATP-binding protein n=1 Tax=Ammoniphilus sp. YIM 78166 TaxID=1644106 RepID=UPI00106FB976|nr:DUF87 domain-containing protein [Ammoniphilus sp. YIM 78166]
MRYHLLRFLIPSPGKYLELRNTLDAKILYFKDETAWANLLISLQRPWYRRIIYQPWVSWEIHATAEAIRYVVWVPDSEIERAFKTKFYSEQPEIEIFDYAPSDVDFSRPHAGMKLLTESHWTVPIKTYHNEVVDTQSEIIEFLSTLKGRQEIRLQFLVQPAYQTERDFRGILRQFERELEDDPSLEEDNKLYVSAIQGKKTRQLSRLSIKAVAFADTEKEAKQLAKACGTSLGTFSSGRLNGLKGREWWWFRTIRPVFRYEFKHRIYSMERMKRYVILGSEEMAAMMRLPSGRVTQNKLQRIKMRRTPLPREVKQVLEDRKPLSVTLGKHIYHGEETDVPLDLETLRYHAAIIGSSGMGKSTALYNLGEDIVHLWTEEQRIGFTVIDPHGDLCKDIAARIPPDKQYLVRYVKFSEGEFPFNVYDIDFHATEDKIAQNVADVLKRTWKDFWGPNIDDNFLNGGIALQRVGEASLSNLQRLLEDPVYRKTVVDRLNPDDPSESVLRRYFTHLDELSERDHQQKTNSTLNKLRKMTLSGTLGPMLGACTNGIPWRKSMDEGQINLVDLSGLTNDEKKMVGSLCLTFAELAGKSRSDTTDRSQLPYHMIFVDEAPTFMEHSADAIESFASELRKFKVSIVLGMQGLRGQVPPDISDAIFRNFGTFISFRLGNPADARQVQEAMHSDLLTEQDFLSIEPYHAYVRMQVGDERTSPFLVRMKPPGQAKFGDAMETIIQRSLAEAKTAEEEAIRKEMDKRRVQQEALARKKEQDSQGFSEAPGDDPGDDPIVDPPVEEKQESLIPVTTVSTSKDDDGFF